jgi:tricorn protease
MRRLSTLLALLFATNLSAAPVQFARTPDISPDGKTVAFGYFGDIWLVPAEGGQARLLTMHEKHDTNPIFSPDGKHLAFSSNRHGSYDVFIVPIEGGRPTRLTFDSADDHPTGWSPDGKSILFASNRAQEYPTNVTLWSVPKEGGDARKIPVTEGREAALSPGGRTIAYTRGPGSWFRKNYKGSSNDDLWICNLDGTHHRRLTTYHGQDNSPMWSPDGKYLYYVSDRFGVANIVKQEMAGDYSGVVGDPVQLTKHASDRVRKARLGAGGKAIVYEKGFDIMVYDVDAGTSRKLDIDAAADDKTNPEKITTFTQNASEYALSTDEKNVAVIVQGEIFLLPRTGGKAKRATDHPAFDHGVAWASDGKKILFLSDRGGDEDIYALESDDSDHADLMSAHKYKVTQITKTPEPEIGVSFSPDSKRVAFLRSNKLYTMSPDGKDEKLIVGDGQVFDYDWSPDGQWFVIGKSDSSFASELYIVPSTGPTKENPARNVTRFANYNGDVTWSRTGNRIGFISRRRGDGTTPYVLSLQKPLAPGAASSKEIDWDGIHLRANQATPMNAREAAISSDGSKIAFRSGQDGDDLWVASSDGGQVTRITTGNTKPTQIQWSKFFGSQIYFRDGNGVVRTANVGGIAPGSPNQIATIPFQARMNVSRDDQYLEIFDQSWRALSDSFYDPQFHGANWRGLRDKYRGVLKHVAMKEDLYHLVFLMMGELNASHLGISGNLGGPEQTTADLGLIFDPYHTGPGYKIAEILKYGPADQRGSKLRAGDIVLSIDDVILDGHTDLAVALNDKAGEIVTLTVTANPDDPRGKRRIELKPAPRPAIHNLYYQRWVDKNAELVKKLSDDKLAYIHIPSMDDAGVEKFLRALYSEAMDKDGIVLDVRFNGGGFTHETILNYLLGKEHTKFATRDGTAGLALNSGDRKWTKPITLLINNRSYSDAEIFPHAFREHGLGKLVGQDTGGLVIGTRNITLIDGSTFRTPRIGVTTNKGVNMEREGVKPDVYVEIHPDQLARGEDPQIEKAIQVLKHDVAVWQKSRTPAASPAASQPPEIESRPRNSDVGAAPSRRPEEK